MKSLAWVGMVISIISLVSVIGFFFAIQESSVRGVLVSEDPMFMFKALLQILFSSAGVTFSIGMFLRKKWAVRGMLVLCALVLSAITIFIIHGAIWLGGVDWVNSFGIFVFAILPISLYMAGILRVKSRSAR